MSNDQNKQRGGQYWCGTAAAPPTDEGLRRWVATLERALDATRIRNVEARNLIRALQHHAVGDDLKRRIKVWLDGGDPPAAPAVPLTTQGLASVKRECCDYHRNGGRLTACVPDEPTRDHRPGCMCARCQTEQIGGAMLSDMRGRREAKR